jgi:16S rRNA (uracil1498-N3)-methyltransferase
MKAYWISNLPEKITPGDIFPLPQDAFHHIVQVCRAVKNEPFFALGSSQKSYEAKLIEVSKKGAQIEILREAKLNPTPKPYLHLCLSVPKFHNLDLIVEKSVELGVKSVRLFTSEFSFVKSKSNSKLSSNWTIARLERLRKIVISACEQSKRPDPMQIYEPVPLSWLFCEIGDTHLTNPKIPPRCLFFYEASPLTASLNFKSLQEVSLQNVEECFYFVGSEGGFSEAEALMAKDKGCEIIHLGDRVLRVETACMAITSVLKYKLGL